MGVCEWGLWFVLRNSSLKQLTEVGLSPEASNQFHTRVIFLKSTPRPELLTLLFPDFVLDSFVSSFI